MTWNFILWPGKPGIFLGLKLESLTTLSILYDTICIGLWWFEDILKVFHSAGWLQPDLKKNFSIKTKPNLSYYHHPLPTTYHSLPTVMTNSSETKRDNTWSCDCNKCWLAKWVKIKRLQNESKYNARGIQSRYYTTTYNPPLTTFYPLPTTHRSLLDSIIFFHKKISDDVNFLVSFYYDCVFTWRPVVVSLDTSVCATLYKKPHITYCFL